jgi:ribosome-binding protein aMBF1 (putative translation factor)
VYQFLVGSAGSVASERSGVHASSPFAAAPLRGNSRELSAKAVAGRAEARADWSEGEEAYDALGEEFDLARALIKARTDAGLSQSQLARRMKTSQSYIARIEGGKVRPSADALGRFAEATGTRLRIVFEPHSTR